MDSGSLLQVQLDGLRDKVIKAQLPKELQEKALLLIEHVQYSSQNVNFASLYESVSRYIKWLTDLPWNKKTKDSLNITSAKQILDKNHYGLTELKERILEYLSVLILRSSNQSFKVSRSQVLSLVGLVGSGKTTIAYSIAQSLGRKIVRIPFGGMGGPEFLRGMDRSSSGAEPGLIMKSLVRAGCNNPVILLDEIDRVSESSFSDIMGVLVELLDPEQNFQFLDHYLDYPFDLSDVFFIATSNNTKNIANAVLDRLEVLQMPSYTDSEKKEIARSFMFPKVLSESGLSNNDLVIDDSLWESIVRPLGFDPGIRSLQRTIEKIVRKVALMIVEGKIKKGQQFAITSQNVREFVEQW